MVAAFSDVHSNNHSDALCFQICPSNKTHRPLYCNRRLFLAVWFQNTNHRFFVFVRISGISPIEFHCYSISHFIVVRFRLWNHEAFDFAVKNHVRFLIFCCSISSIKPLSVRFCCKKPCSISPPLLSKTRRVWFLKLISVFYGPILGEIRDLGAIWKTFDF